MVRLKSNAAERRIALRVILNLLMDSYTSSECQVDASFMPLQWEIQVEHGGGMWWTMPHWLSDPILQVWQQGHREVSFIWDWKDARNGSYKPNGQTTSINRYIINFDTMYQKNTDKPNKGDRKVKIVSIIR